MRADLSTYYLGLPLRNPIVASAGPMTGDLDSLRDLEQAGIAAVVLPSLFEEQISHDEQRIHAVYEYQTDATAESLSLLSGNPGLQRRAARVSQLDRGRQASRLGAGDRQPQRLVAGRLGPVRQADSGRRRGCDRAEHLLRAHRPDT